MDNVKNDMLSTQTDGVTFGLQVQSNLYFNCFSKASCTILTSIYNPPVKRDIATYSTWDLYGK